MNTMGSLVMSSQRSSLLLRVVHDRYSIRDTRMSPDSPISDFAGVDSGPKLSHPHEGEVGIAAGFIGGGDGGEE